VCYRNEKGSKSGEILPDPTEFLFCNGSGKRYARTAKNGKDLSFFFHWKRIKDGMKPVLQSVNQASKGE
jgi:hypothetical protein